MTTAVVVGGGSGIGAAVAERQRLQGVEVLTWDLGDGADIRCDITDAAQVDQATDATVERIGVPSLVTVTAGIGHSAFLLDAPADAWDRVVGTNAKGVWLVIRALARRMIDSDGGSIVATSSVSARLADRSDGPLLRIEGGPRHGDCGGGIGAGAQGAGQRRGAGSHRYAHARSGAP